MPGIGRCGAALAWGAGLARRCGGRGLGPGLAWGAALVRRWRGARAWPGVGGGRGLGPALAWGAAAPGHPRTRASRTGGMGPGMPVRGHAPVRGPWLRRPLLGSRRWRVTPWWAWARSLGRAQGSRSAWRIAIPARPVGAAAGATGALRCSRSERRAAMAAGGSWIDRPRGSRGSTKLTAGGRFAERSGGRRRRIHELTLRARRLARLRELHRGCGGPAQLAGQRRPQ